MGDKVPRSPEQIAKDAIRRQRQARQLLLSRVTRNWRAARDVYLYKEVVERIRASNTDVVVNLTAGMGGDIVFGPPGRRCPCRKRELTWCRRPSVSSILKSADPRSRRSIVGP